MARWNRAAFEREMIGYLDPLYNTALRLTRNEAQARDLVQDTFVKALRFWDSYKPGTNSKAWIFKVMMNIFYTDYGKRASEGEILSLSAFDLGGEGEAREFDIPDTADVDSRVLDAIQDEAITAAIDALPPDYRAVILMSEIEEMPYREIADVLDIPAGTVMSRLHRARRILRDTMRNMAIDRGIVAEEMTT